MAPSKILVPVDLSPFTEKAIAYAADLVRDRGGSVTVITVINDVFPYFDFFPVEYTQPDYFHLMKERAESELRQLTDRILAGVTHEVVIRRGYPATEIVQAASEGQHDLIVMATHGHSGLEHALLGSITEKVLRKAHCPVLVVR